MKSSTADIRPSPEEFDDYREYLRVMTAYLKEHQRAFSFRAFAMRGGVSSPSLLTDVMGERRQLPRNAITKFAKGLGLSRPEADAFEALVLMGRAKTDEERTFYFDRLRRRRGPPGGQVTIERAQYDVYSLWYALPVRELMLLPDFQEDPAWIARRLLPSIRPHQAKKALDLLEQIGLAVRDEEGKLRPADAKITSPINVRSLAARNYHREMLRIASDSLDGIPKEKRNITSLNILLDENQYEELCQRIMEFQDEIVENIEGNPSEDKAKKTLFWLGFEVVPLTKDKEEDDIEDEKAAV